MLITAYYGTIAPVLRYGLIFGATPRIKKALSNVKRDVSGLCLGFRQPIVVDVFLRHYSLTLHLYIHIFEVALFVKRYPYLFPSLSDTVVRNRRKYTLCIRRDNTSLMQMTIFFLAPNFFSKLTVGYKQSNISNFKKNLLSTMSMFF